MRNINQKEGEQVGVTPLYSRLQVSHWVMGGVKFIRKNDSEL